MKIAIIGAGMAGMSCATALQAGGHVVAVIDKGSAPGGRMATRRVTTPSGEVAFDHGAQYFRSRETAFAVQVGQWEATGVVAAWPEAGADAWVGRPAMNSVARALSASTMISSATRA